MLVAMFVRLHPPRTILRITSDIEFTGAGLAPTLEAALHPPPPDPSPAYEHGQASDAYLSLVCGPALSAPAREAWPWARHVHMLLLLSVLGMGLSLPSILPCTKTTLVVGYAGLGHVCSELWPPPDALAPARCTPAFHSPPPGFTMPREGMTRGLSKRSLLGT